MATLMPICAGLLGPKSENVEISSVLNAFLKWSRGARVIQMNEHPRSPDRLGGGRGRVNPPPCGLVLRFGRFGGFGDRFGGVYTPRGKSLSGFLAV